MSDAVVGVTQGVSPDRLVDNESLTVGTNTVYRQRVEVAGAAAAEIARVENAQPAAGDYGLVVRNIPTGTQAVNNTQVSGTAVDVNTGVATAGTQRVVLATPSTVLAGYQSFTATTAATTLVTIPAGKTWTGTVAVSAACAETAAATVVPNALGVISVAGAGATPAAGNYFGVQATSGANATTGTVGSGGSNFGSLPMIVVAPAGNAVTIQVTVTVAGTAGRVDASAFGTTV